MRLFIAIRFSPAVGRRLCEAMESLGRQALSAGLTRPENLHLTLAFIGEADDIGPICRVMDASAPPAPSASRWAARDGSATSGGRACRTARR